MTRIILILTMIVTFSGCIPRTADGATGGLEGDNSSGETVFFPDLGWAGGLIPPDWLIPTDPGTGGGGGTPEPSWAGKYAYSGSPTGQNPSQSVLVSLTAASSTITLLNKHNLGTTAKPKWGKDIYTHQKPQENKAVGARVYKFERKDNAGKHVTKPTVPGQNKYVVMYLRQKGAQTVVVKSDKFYDSAGNAGTAVTNAAKPGAAGLVTKSFLTEKK